MGVKPSPTVLLQRRILSLAQLVLSHSLSFFFLSAPDIILGLDAAPSERNLTGLLRHNPEIIRKYISDKSDFERIEKVNR